MLYDAEHNGSARRTARERTIQRVSINDSDKAELSLCFFTVTLATSSLRANHTGGGTV